MVVDRCSVCCADPVETKGDLVFRWAGRLLIASSIFMAGGAVGFMEGAIYIADEANTRFDCVQKN